MNAAYPIVYIDAIVFIMRENDMIRKEAAVSAFRQEAIMPATGVADQATQEALFAENAPKRKVNTKLDYKIVAREPSAYEGDLITFSGKVLQVMESGCTGIYTYETIVGGSVTIPFCSIDGIELK